MSHYEGKIARHHRPTTFGCDSHRTNTGPRFRQTAPRVSDRTAFPSQYFRFYRADPKPVAVLRTHADCNGGHFSAPEGADERCRLNQSRFSSITIAFLTSSCDIW